MVRFFDFLLFATEPEEITVVTKCQRTSARLPGMGVAGIPQISREIGGNGACRYVGGGYVAHRSTNCEAFAAALRCASGR